MAEFTSDVMKSTQEQDDTEYQKFQDLLKKQTAAAQKQFAGKYETPVAAPVSLADQLKTKTAYQTGEYGRREQAAQNKYGLAQAIDARRGGLSDRIRSALFGRQQSQSEAQDKMRQTERAAGLQTQQINREFQTAVGKMNFYSYKSAADRTDAIHDAYNKGILDFQMLDAARNNMLATADIERYFATLKNGIENKMRDAVAFGDLELKEMIRQFEAQSRSTGTIITGVTDIAKTLSSNYFSE
jgi:hypothetical protein